MKSFLQSYLKLLRDEHALLKMQNLIEKCKQLTSMATANKAVHHIKKYLQTGREMRLTAQIRDYDMDEVILDLGYEVNILMK